MWGNCLQMKRMDTAVANVALVRAIARLKSLLNARGVCSAWKMSGRRKMMTPSNVRNI